MLFTLRDLALLLAVRSLASRGEKVEFCSLPFRVFTLLVCLFITGGSWRQWLMRTTLKQVTCSYVEQGHKAIPTGSGSKRSTQTLPCFQQLRSRLEQRFQEKAP